MISQKHFLRILHGLISLYFGLCIIQIYYSFFTDTRSLFLYIALISVWVEGFVVFILNKGDCPMFYLHQKVGDDKYFFELFMPLKYAKMVIPVVGVITIFGSGLLFLRWFGLL